MKKILLLLVALFSSLPVLNAKHVTPERAKTIAMLLMKDKVSDFTGEIKSVRPLDRGFEESIYLINFYPKGWMLLSADDNSLPLLAYSPTGHFHANLMPESMHYWLTTYEDQILENANLGDKSLKQWSADYYTYQRKTRVIGSPIEPLIKVEWNQRAPYNAFCPKSGSKRALVGCVAVAMGQALSVLQYPARPIGKHTDGDPTGIPFGTIDYDKEQPYDWERILDGSSDGYNEVARFLYHMGTSVDMSYGIDGSGAYTYEIPTALMDHFSFPEDVYFLWREEYEGDWKQLIINELGAGRPLIYNGVDEKADAGHAFNVDGYDGKGDFHVNWGWGGSGNAYYSLDALRDDVMHHNYAHQQGAVIGLRAPGERPTNIKVSNMSAPSGMKAGQFVGIISVENQQSGHTYEYQVRGKYNTVMQSYDEVPFTVDGDKLLTSGSLSASDKFHEIEIVAIDKDLNVSIKQGFTIQITGNSEALKSVEEMTTVSFNKKNQQLKLTCHEGVSYQIITSEGATLVEGKFPKENVFTWNTKDIPAGVYTVKLSDEDDHKSFTLRINPKK